MKTPEIHALLTQWGALSPKEIVEKAIDVDPDANYQAVYSRLLYGTQTGAFDRFRDAHGQVLYRANPDWKRKLHGKKGGAQNSAARNMLVFLREEKGLTFAKCGEQMGVSPAAAYTMYQRILAKRALTEDPSVFSTETDSPEAL